MLRLPGQSQKLRISGQNLIKPMVDGANTEFQLLKKASGAEVVIERVNRAQNLRKPEIQKAVSEAIKLVRSVVRTETVGLYVRTSLVRKQVRTVRLG
jgi:hypothetical protein